MAIANYQDRLAAKVAKVAKPENVEASNDAPIVVDAPLTVTSKLPTLNADSVKNDVVERLNKSCFIAPHGHGVAVHTERIDHELDRPVLSTTTIPAFKELHRADVVMVPDSDGVRPIRAAEIWLQSPDRRCYTGGVGLFPDGNCPPDVYNLYRGFGVEAKAGDISFLLGYIKSLLCSGNEEQFQYLIKWLAYAVQHPERQAEVAIVLRGGKGIGKSTLGRLMVSLFGAHGMQITNSRHLLGNFNGHMRTTLLLFADEAFFAGDAQGASVLKGLVTEEYLVVEQKGVDPIQIRNRLKIIMASNSDWVVPASGDERRFFVLEVSDEKQGDHAYWSELNKQIANGGAEGFLDYLLNVDLTGFNVRDVPHTAGLANQKLQSLGALDGFLFDALAVESLDSQVWESDKGIEIPCGRFAQVLTDYCQKHPRHRYNIPSSKQIGMNLYDMVGATRAQLSTGNRARTYKFPSLLEAREIFARWAHLGKDYKWEDAE
jgi:hypothetical protein